MKATVIYSNFRYYLHYFFEVKEYDELFGEKVKIKEEVAGFKTIQEAKEYYSILNDKEKTKSYIWDIVKKERVEL